ncbi:MAG TPA: hypothetical protein VMI10_19435 [Terriglobales bacterium]|nr:hypothetical protein [Terriglobales bacterium]
MTKKIIPSILVFLLLGCLVMAQKPPQQKAQPAQPPATSDLVNSLARQLGHELKVETVIGEPIKVGSVTLIPILMVDLKFGGAAATMPVGASTPTPAPQSAGSQPNLFFMSGEAQPLGVVVISGKGTRLINLVKSDTK